MMSILDQIKIVVDERMPDDVIALVNPPKLIKVDMTIIDDALVIEATFMRDQIVAVRVVSPENVDGNEFHKG